MLPPSHSYLSAQLGSFIQESDRLGGPGNPACEAYWSTFTYLPTVRVDQDLDPYSAAYMDAMLDLYQEISNRNLNQSTHEQTAFDLQTHISASNPYAHRSPSALARLMATLLQGAAAADKPNGASVLDMGAGWGLSSEVFEYLGYRVTAVDINSRFVELVASRARKRGLSIAAIQSSFEDFMPAQKFDLAMFFECLHHCVRPWGLLERLHNYLKPDGVLLLLAEPVQNTWWKHWGLRLDALSVYCIRKYGWFESGWSLSFLFDMLSRAGFATLPIRNSANPDHSVFFCSKTRTFTKRDLEKSIFLDQAYVESEFLISKGDLSLQLGFPKAVTSVSLELWNFRPRKLRVTIRNAGGTEVEADLVPGKNLISIPYVGGLFSVQLLSECWYPDSEIGNADSRRLSFHLASVFGAID